MRALIIGCGYVGLPLGAELVKQGHEVFGLRRTRWHEDHVVATGIRPLVGDVTRPETLATVPAEYDWVVNCVSSSKGGVQEYRAVYLEGMRHLLAWLSARPPARFVYTSSTSVYGQTDNSIVTELSVAAPEAETATILKQAEEVLSHAAESRAFPSVILRVAGIYGPGRGYWFQQFLNSTTQTPPDEGSAGRRQSILPVQGTRILNMIHRDDVVGVIITALKRARPGSLYNAVDDEPVTQRDFFQWLASRLGRPLPLVRRESSSSGKRVATSKWVSNLKLKHELEYRFKYPTFREGYAEEIAKLVAAK